MSHTPGRWRVLDGVVVAADDAPLHNGDRTVEETAANAYLIAAAPDLLAAARAAVAYDVAIQSCANDPKQMASFCSAEGDDLDALYLDWITKATEGVAKATPA